MSKRPKKRVKKKPQKSVWVDIPDTLHRAVAFQKSGRLDKAVLLYQRVLKVEPDNFDALQLLGAVALQQENAPRAAKLISAAVAIRPDLPDLWCNLGSANKRMGNNLRAIECYKTALDRDASLLQARVNLARVYMAEGLLEEAIAHLKEALRLKPNDLTMQQMMGQALAQAGQSRAAIEQYQKAMDAGLCSYEAYVELGELLHESADLKGAVRAYRQAAEIQPDGVDIYTRLADVLEQSYQLEASAEAAQMALMRQPDNRLAGLILARVERRSGDLQLAQERLGALTDDSDQSDLMAAIYTELGLVRDRQGEYASAFQAFAQGNRLQKNQKETLLEPARQRLKQIQDAQEWFTHGHIQALKQARDDGPVPSFLVGFPRSGTTLTEQVLAAHPHLTLGDEWPILDHMVKLLPELLGRPITYPQGLSSLTDAELVLLRGHYWAAVQEWMGGAKIKGHFIDKMPLNLLHLGLVRCIFPQAKVILALRDPRDVCLSCFMQHFRLNETMVHFLDLQDTADFYAEVMKLGICYRDNLGLDWIDTRYEDLVADFRGTVERLLDFLGLSWDDQLYDYAGRAVKQGISTPSYQAVTEPIYSRAIGRWRHYSGQMEPMLSVLDPYVRLLGYNAEPG